MIMRAKTDPLLLCPARDGKRHEFVFGTCCYCDMNRADINRDKTLKRYHKRKDVW